jgi:hypothetical protein
MTRDTLPVVPQPVRAPGNAPAGTPPCAMSPGHVPSCNMPPGADGMPAEHTGDAAACTELSPRHHALEADGWTRRFAAAPPRLEEMSRTYAEIGLAVLHEPLDDSLLDAGCTGCAPARATFRVIYTRKEP